MAVSEKQLTANRANAQKSTGPVSIEGKVASRTNAMRHGMFSKRTLIDGEDPNEFDAVVLDLQDTMNPVGTLEIALVEKIALGMWRQRRLANAEAAAIRLRRRLPKVAKTLSHEMDLGFSKELSEKDLVPFDAAQVDWCNKVVAEFDALDEIDLESLPKLAPLIHKQLVSDAEEHDEDSGGYLEAYENGVTGYAVELVSWCRKQLRKAEKRPTVLALAEQVRARSQILDQRELELLSRYQTALDNQLFRTIKALRDAQEWRLKTLDAIADAPPTDLQSVA